MSYRFSSTQIHEIVQAPKRPAAGQRFEPRKKGKEGLSFSVFLELVEGSYLDLRFLGSAGVSRDPSSYDASLLLDQERVRGIGYAAVGRKNFRAKKRIPAGCDFGDFTRLTADRWHIDLGVEGGLL